MFELLFNKSSGKQRYISSDFDVDVDAAGDALDLCVGFKPRPRPTLVSVATRSRADMYFSAVSLLDIE